ncbi:MAG: cytochrome c biogenesis protein CcsA, partial [Pseudomonadota bacterium]
MKIADKCYHMLWICALSLLTIGVYMAFWNSPPDYQQGDTVRIMYIHVPAAYLSVKGYLVVSIASLIFLIWKNPFSFIVARSCAHIGIAFCAICLLSGALWGQPMWGTWWVW